MNEDKNKSQSIQSEIKSIIGNPVSTAEDHPLHILDNQSDPSLKPPKPDIGQKPIRTYESDVAEALARGKSSVVSIAIAESRKREDEDKANIKPAGQINKKALSLLMSLIFIVTGLGGGYYLYLQSPLARVALHTVPTLAPSIIPPDIQKVIDVPSLEKISLEKLVTRQFNNQEIKAGKITEFILGQTSGSTTIRITSPQFITSLELNVTDTLKRSLTNRLMTGVYSTNDRGVSKNEPFIILTTDFFQNAFAGMLKWEGYMPEDLANIFNLGSRTETSNTAASTTATSTKLTTFYNMKGNFKDRVVSNRDIREFIDENGNILFLYTFIDKNTILITTSESVIPALLERIEKQTYVR